MFTLITLSTPARVQEEEEEAVFISVVNTNEDPPNAHQAQQEEEEAVFIRGVNTNEDSPNAQHAPHRSVQGGGGGGLYS